MEKSANTQYEDLSAQANLKIGVISDTHSYIDPAIIQQLDNCDAILHAGDIGSIDVIQQLKKVCPKVISVRGNNDIQSKWSSNEHNELEKIPELAEIKLPGGDITMVHGDQYFSVSVRHEKMREDFSSSKAIVYGHSHIMTFDKSENPWMLNPGAAGKTRTKGGASCLLIHADQQAWEVTQFRVE